MIKHIKGFKTNFKLKLFLIRKLLKSDKFVFIDFGKQNKENGYVNGYFSAGFKKDQVHSTLNLAQKIHIENMTLDVYDSIIEETNKLLTK